MEGFIKIHRQLIENPLWLIKPFSEGQAWIDLLCLANHKKGFIKTKNGQIIEIQRGQCGYSVLSLSERWGWSRGKVTRFFELLTIQQMIQQKKYGKHTVINILNYDKYQKRATNDTINDTTNDTTNGQQTDTNKNDKNEKNINLSLSINCEEEKREREILKKFCKRNNVKNTDAYIRKLIDNGDAQTIVREEKRRLEKKQVVQEQPKQEQENPEEIHAAFLAAKERLLQARRRA